MSHAALSHIDGWCTTWCTAAPYLAILNHDAQVEPYCDAGCTASGHKLMPARQWAILLCHNDAWCTALSHADAWCTPLCLGCTALSHIDAWCIALSHIELFWCLIHSIKLYWCTSLSCGCTSIKPYWCMMCTHIDGMMHGIELYIFDAWCTALSYTDPYYTSMSRGCTALSHGAQYWAIFVARVVSVDGKKGCIIADTDTTEQQST